MIVLQLPHETLARIAHFASKSHNQGLTHLQTLKNLRLTCRKLAAISTQSLFHTATLVPEQNSYEKFYALQKHPELCSKVRNLILKTSVDPEEEDAEDFNELSDALRDAIASIGKFPNLSSLHLRFRARCSDERRFYNYVKEGICFRTEVMETVFAALCDKTLPTSRFRSLSIENLQDLNSPEIINSSHFKDVLSRIAELHLHIATEDEQSCPENNISNDTLHTFFDELPRVWLEPVQERLTHLTLYTDTYWGWAPVFEPRGIHFPKLKYLALGNHTFAHDSQIEWITSHGSTLETLILDDCPILFYIWPSDSLRKHTSKIRHDDHDIFLNREEPSDNNFLQDNRHWIYKRRWHHFFPRLESGLSELTKFTCGHGDWPNGAFEERDQIVSVLKQNRYIAFNGGIGPSQWEEPCGDSQIYESFEAVGWDEVLLKTPAVAEPPYMLLESSSEQHAVTAGSQDTDTGEGGCQKEDEEAFLSLSRAVARRAMAKGVS